MYVSVFYLMLFNNSICFPDLPPFYFYKFIDKCLNYSNAHIIIWGFIFMIDWNQILVYDNQNALLIQTSNKFLKKFWKLEQAFDN